MRCIFVDGTKCVAQVNTGVSWRPEGEDMQRGCATYNFQDCPRYKAYIEYLRARAGGQ